MFKKTLVAAALAGALVGSAFAANVTLYGVVDEGLVFQHQKTENFKSAQDTDSTNTFQLNSGVDASSRFGLKGTESLGNGYAVSFKLENGFNADDGTLKQSGRLFGREASLTVSGPFGALSAGRMGGVASAAGTYDVVYAIGDAFDGGASLGFNLQASDRYDNVVTYQTPKFAGLQATAQYSFKKDTQDKEDGGTEGKSEVNRYASFALTGEYGNLQLVAAYEREMWGNTHYTKQANGSYTQDATTPDNDDQNTFYLGGNYDFGVAKVFAMGQYFTGARTFGAAGDQWDIDGNHGFSAAARNSTDGYKGYGFHLGTIVPVLGGDATFGLYYAHAKSDDMAQLADPANVAKLKINSYGAAARYEYPLSKRTLVYTGVEYYYEKGEVSGTNTTWSDQDAKETTVGAYLGLKHTF